MKSLDQDYAGKVHEFNDILPPDLQSQIKNKQEFLAAKKAKTLMDKIEISKFHDESTQIKNTEMNEASNVQSVIEFEDDDEEAGEH